MGKKITELHHLFNTECQIIQAFYTDDKSFRKKLISAKGITMDKLAKLDLTNYKKFIDLLRVYKNKYGTEDIKKEFTEQEIMDKFKNFKFNTKYGITFKKMN